MAKPVELKTKGVVFNVLDEGQKELYELALSKSNFSGYIKRLMVEDMLGIRKVEKRQEQAENKVKIDVGSFV